MLYIANGPGTGGGMTNPMNTGGDIIYGGLAGTPTRLANGTAGQVLTSQGTTLAPVWSTVGAGTVTSVSSANADIGVATGTTTPVLTLNSATAATASTVVKRDASANIYVNNYFANTASTVSAGGTTVLTVASARTQNLTGSSTQTFQLPDATTLALSSIFEFNNNSSSSLTITNAGAATQYTVPAGGAVQCFCTSIGTANGTWDFHALAPQSVTWGSGIVGLVMNSVLTTTPSIASGASSATVPAFIPQRGSATTGYSGDSTNLFGVIGGATAFTSTASTFTVPGTLIGGVNATTLGKVKLFGNTSGDVTLQPNAVAGTGIVLTLPATTGTLALTSQLTSGTVTAVSIASANGVSGSSSGGATPALTISLGAITPSTVNGNTFTTGTYTLTGTAAKTLNFTNTLTLSGTDGTTMTFPTTSATVARTDAAQTFTGAQTYSQVIYTNNAITASGNAATVPITSRVNTVTNNSAATLTITLATASAVDRQLCEVLVLDFSAVAQTITWVNTENSLATAPVTSNGSTTLPVSVLFQYNNATSKWRCIAAA